MSIVDSKGRLFGKLNIIDLIAIIVIIAVVALLGMKLLSNSDSAGLGGEGEPVVYTVLVKGVEAEVYESIQNELPSQLMASGELLDGYVTKVEATPAEEDEYSISESNGVTTISREDSGEYDLVFTIEATVEDNVTSELGTQEIRVGKSHIVKTTTFELEGGTILTCQRQEQAAE
jgi:hypothetical protein